MVVEDLDSLNGTFVNDLRASAPPCTTADNIHIASTKSRSTASGDAPLAWDTGRKAAARASTNHGAGPKERRQMLQQAAPWANPCSLRARA